MKFGPEKYFPTHNVDFSVCVSVLAFQYSSMFVHLFNGVSTLLDNAKSILLEEQ